MIDKLTKEHIRMYAKSQNIHLINNEDEIIYDFLKNNFDKLMNEDYNEEIIKDLRCKLSFNTYNSINNLYKEAKEKIRN